MVQPVPMFKTQSWETTIELTNEHASSNSKFKLRYEHEHDQNNPLIKPRITHDINSLKNKLKDKSPLPLKKKKKTITRAIQSAIRFPNVLSY